MIEIKHWKKLQNIKIIHSPYLVGVGVRHGLGGVDGLVEEWVGEGGVVELVVTVAAVAHQVEEDVAPEPALVLKAELRRLHHVLVRNNGSKYGSCQRGR